MNKIIIVTALISLNAFFYSCTNSPQPMPSSKATSLFSDDCKLPLVCKLTSPEMKQRKVTVLALLQRKVLEKRELKNGYAFKFQGNDAMIDTLIAFIKSEKQCCDFFTFDLAVRGDQDVAWLQLTGPEGTKDFIKSEMEL